MKTGMDSMVTTRVEIKNFSFNSGKPTPHMYILSNNFQSRK